MKISRCLCSAPAYKLPGALIVPRFEYPMYSILVLANRHLFIFICHVIYSLPDVLKFQSCINMENLMYQWLFNKPEGVSLIGSQSNARGLHTVARIVFICFLMGSGTLIKFLLRLHMKNQMFECLFSIVILNQGHFNVQNKTNNFYGEILENDCS